jgi:tetratricopeptide (TPR) repeat protein
MQTRQLPLLIPLLLFTGCIQTIAVRSVGGIVEEGYDALTEESDLQFAEQALPGNIKLLEVMLKNDPDNKRLLKLCAEGYASYALGFVEDVDVERARVFYLRGRDYGMRMLEQDKDLKRALAGSADDLQAALAKKSKDLVPAVFWTAFPWGGYLNITLTDPEAIAAIPKLEVMMNFVAERDSAFYFGGAHLFLGTLYGSRSRFLGGNPDNAKEHFEAALRLNEGKFLMTHVYYAKSYAFQTQNEELFDQLLKYVEDASLDILPQFRLGNAIAKKKAKMLMEKKEELF